MLHNNMLKHISGFLLAIAVVPFSLALSSCGCGTSSRQSGAGTQGSEEKAYYPKAAGSFRIMSYNVGNFSKYLPFNDNIDMIASMIKESEADVVALNEIDSLTQRLPYDELSLLTKALGGWQWHFGRAMPYQGGAYGEGCIVPGKVKIISAHREPDVFYEYAKSAESKGFKVIIAGAGKAAHLPGMCAAIFPMPVIGIPMKTSDLGGVDSLYSIVQMPSGIPVATVAINGGQNAGILAAKILATSDPVLLQKLKEYSQSLKESVQKKDAKLQEVGYKNYQ